jgi:CheY-like chemotaxis protein
MGEGCYMASKKYKILVVEDDKELSRLYKTRLEKGDFEVDTAGDGEEALVKALSWEPNFIILDLMLPKTGGIQVMRILKSNMATKDIPILILTAYDNANYRNDTQTFCVNYALKTQTTPQQIVEIINGYFAKK